MNMTVSLPYMGTLFALDKNEQLKDKIPAVDCSKCLGTLFVA